MNPRDVVGVLLRRSRMTFTLTFRRRLRDVAALVPGGQPSGFCGSFCCLAAPGPQLPGLCDGHGGGGPSCAAPLLPCQWGLRWSGPSAAPAPSRGVSGTASLLGARSLQPVSCAGCRRRRCPQRPGGPVPGPVPAASGSSAGKTLTRVVSTRLVTGTPACRTGSGETRPPAQPFPPAALRGGAHPGASHAARPWHVSFSPTYRRLQFPPSLSLVPAALRPFASSVCPSPVS